MNLLIPSPYCYIVGAVIWILIIGAFIRDWTQDYNQTHPKHLDQHANSKQHPTPPPKS